MKKTIYQLQHLKRVSLKSIITIILLSVFTASFGQVKDPPGFDAAKERQKAIAEGVHAEELEGYIEAKRKCALITYEYKTYGKGNTNFKPPLSFSRKSWNGSPACEGTFENNDVLPWSAEYGMNDYGISSFVNNTAIFYPGVAYNRHTIMTAGNYDPLITTIPVVRPGGGQHSLRLGNSGTGAEAERVSKTVTVSGSCLSFWYALVLEDPAHNYNDQSFFMFRLFDSANNVLDSFVREASNDPFFSRQGSYAYRDWTKYTVELGCDYRGKTVTIEFTTSDCRLSADFGYAYIDDVCFENCVSCCSSCSDMLNSPGFFNNYDVIRYLGSTDSTCCFKFQPIFDPDIFRCLPAQIKVFKDGSPSTVYSSYTGSTPITYGFNPSMLDFCLNRNVFTSPITLRIGFYDSSGNLLCDTIKQTIEPCHSTSSGCNCNSLFENSNFANTSIIKKDTAASDEYECCFTLEPFRDSTIMKCSYYGMRVYKDTTWGPSNPYIDSFSATPIGGPGANMNDTGKIKFCISAYTFSNLGPQKLRIEYLDSNGKVICSKTETVNCEESCCENVLITVTKDTTETDPNNCCISIFGHLGNCFSSATIELTEYTDSGWVTTSVSPASPMGMFSFVNLCRPNGDTTRYMIFIKDSTGKILCNKEVIQTCPNCCDLVSYTATYVPPSSPYLDRCCWDINVSPTASMECNVWNWGVYDSLHNVPSSYPPFMPPSSTYQGRHCTPYIFAPNPAPGTSITINYCITRYLAVYDNLGAILCIKPIELCCSRTYTNNEGNPQGPFGIEIAPNPFDETFTVSMDVPQEMPVAVNVVNSIGAVVFTKDYGIQPQGMFTKEINLVGQPAGIYTLSVNNGLATVQIVKQ